MNILVPMLLLAVITSLGWSLRLLLNSGPDKVALVKALSWRVGLSILLFGMVLASKWLHMS